ncbi:vanZ like family protein [archaeon BMS3Abin17]|nr:vanZ like family protein [archaeon BMS3Abin17]HDZ60938.1 hypothetical protein [Candidatus Pacearchaeota archaeon]
MVLRWFEKHNKISWVVTLIGAIAIFYISTITFGPGISRINMLSTLYHFSAFFCFALFLQISSLKGKKKYAIFILALIISIIYGITDELHQYFIPGRDSSFFDIGVDALGALSSSLIYLLSVGFRNK